MIERSLLAAAIAGEALCLVVFAVAYAKAIVRAQSARRIRERVRK